MTADPDRVCNLDEARARRAHRQRATAPKTGGMWVGPTSDQTRRLVAESRQRQGLSPGIDNPAAVEALALFLRNALDTLDHDERRDAA